VGGVSLSAGSRAAATASSAASIVGSAPSAGPVGAAARRRLRVEGVAAGAPVADRERVDVDRAPDDGVTGVAPPAFEAGD
jgi:hypothetical protein